jgi:hypothetical protein
MLVISADIAMLVDCTTQDGMFAAKLSPGFTAPTFNI